MTQTLSRDVAALCAAVDDGDDGALPALADALEEAQDPRATGLRHPALALLYEPAVMFCDGRGRWGWGLMPDDPDEASQPWELPDGLFERLPVAGVFASPRLSAEVRERKSYPTRSAAYLALAAALAETTRRADRPVTPPTRK